MRLFILHFLELFPLGERGQTLSFWHTFVFERDIGVTTGVPIKKPMFGQLLVQTDPMCNTRCYMAALRQLEFVLRYTLEKQVDGNCIHINIPRPPRLIGWWSSDSGVIAARQNEGLLKNILPRDDILYDIMYSRRACKLVQQD